jgi:hypothetical protein
MNKIETRIISNIKDPLEYRAIFIEDKLLQDVLQEEFGEEFPKDLIPAFVYWLSFAGEKDLLYKVSEKKSLVPILTHPEYEMEINSHWVEIEYSTDKVIWKRMGSASFFNFSYGEMEEDDIDWFEPIFSLTFDRREYEKCIQAYKEDLKKAIIPQQINNWIDEISNIVKKEELLNHFHFELEKSEFWVTIVLTGKEFLVDDSEDWMKRKSKTFKDYSLKFPIGYNSWDKEELLHCIKKNIEILYWKSSLENVLFLTNAQKVTIAYKNGVILPLKLIQKKVHIDPSTIINYMIDKIVGLEIKWFIIKKAQKVFSITENEALLNYRIALYTIKPILLKRALIFLIVGSVPLGVGLASLLNDKTTFILVGMLLIGTGAVISGLIYLLIYLYLILKGIFIQSKED